MSLRAIFGQKNTIKGHAIKYNWRNEVNAVLFVLFPHTFEMLAET